MSIDMIDDFVGWTTSLNDKDQAKPSREDAALPGFAGDDLEAVYSGLLHVPKTHPPPSQIAFLRQRLQKEMVERFKILYPDEDTENHSNRAHELLGCLDSSALVSIGFIIEEVMTMVMWSIAAGWSVSAIYSQMMVWNKKTRRAPLNLVWIHLLHGLYQFQR